MVLFVRGLLVGACLVAVTSGLMWTSADTAHRRVPHLAGVFCLAKLGRCSACPSLICQWQCHWQ